MTLARMTVLVSLGALGACNNFGFQGQRVPFGTGVGAAPTPQRGVNTATAKSGGASALQTKTVCRSIGMEPGWIAIDYLADAGGCTQVKQGTNGHPVALIANYRMLNVGAELEVCAPEHVPTGWNFDSWVDAEGRCPDDGNNDSPDAQKHLVKRIRRID